MLEGYVWLARGRQAESLRELIPKKQSWAVCQSFLSHVRKRGIVEAESLSFYGRRVPENNGGAQKEI